MIHDEQMLAMLVELVCIPAPGGGLRVRVRRHLFIEDAVPQRLCRIDLGGRGGQPDLHSADLDRARRRYRVRAVHDTPARPPPPAPLRHHSLAPREAPPPPNPATPTGP